MLRLPRRHFDKRMKSLDRLELNAEKLRNQQLVTPARDLELAIEIGREAVKKMHEYETQLAIMRQLVFKQSCNAHQKIKEVIKWDR